MPAPPRADNAERRQLTVMFCDLVGSTALASRLDPEDLREVIGTYHKCAAETIGRYDGFVAKYMGDGVLAYFGYPQAHEDDAERAVRAGLAVIEAVGQLPTQHDLSVRLGVATGLAVVGDLLGEGAAQERGVVGETPNLAARLQGLAEPNAVVISAGTRRLVGHLFDYRDLGAVEAKGFPEPLQAYQVLRPSTMESRFEALRSEATPLVGRDEELDLLLRRWRQAKAGEGRAVLVSGEPGIGKSRLAAALSQAIQKEAHTRLRYFCSPYYQDSALHPFIVQLERAAGLARDDTVEKKLGKFVALLAPGARGDDEIELLAELLSLPSSAADLNLSSQRKREVLLEALLHQLAAAARSRPVLTVFEDAQWIDPTSRELLDLTLDRVRRLPVLLVVTFRPEFEHAWSGQPHVTMLTLNRLGEHHGAVLVGRLAGNTSLSHETIGEIVERADGVPLFVEELTKAVLESADRDNRVGAVLAGSPLPSLAIPPTLHASLIARLDRLGPSAKEVAQIGAVIGRAFSFDLIEQVAQRPRAALRSGLDRLTEAGLLFCRGIAPQSSYLFKHALVQDTAVATLLRANRQELHARVAAALESNFADLVERQPELLARHLTSAGETGRAVDQWLKAGKHAAARSAYLEAIRHLDRGLATLVALHAGPARDGREIELQLARGLSLFTSEGYSSAEASRAYARAHELTEARDDPLRLFVAVYGLWQSASGRAMIRDCRRLSDRLLELAADTTDDELHLQAHHSAWATCLHSGEPATAREHCDVGLRLYDPERHRTHLLLYGGHDPGVCASNIGARARWQLGYPDTGLTIGREGLALAERIAHPFTLVTALLWSAMLHLDRGEPDLALRRLSEAETHAAEQRVGFVWEPLFLRGKALSIQGAFEDAIVCFGDGLAGGLGAARSRGYGLVGLAEAFARRGGAREGPCCG
jgi:class 3 adenylate cyclase